MYLPLTPHPTQRGVVTIKRVAQLGTSFIKQRNPVTDPVNLVRGFITSDYAGRKRGREWKRQTERGIGIQNSFAKSCSHNSRCRPQGKLRKPSTTTRKRNKIIIVGSTQSSAVSKQLLAREDDDDAVAKLNGNYSNNSKEICCSKRKTEERREKKKATETMHTTLKVAIAGNDNDSVETARQRDYTHTHQEGREAHPHAVLMCSFRF